MTLQVEALHKRFGPVVALDGLTFEVPGGEIFGFLGANGAGKTTTMRIALGVLEADAGRVVLDGTDTRELPRRTWGYLPEERGLYPRMVVLDQLAFFASLHGVPRDIARRSALDWLTRLRVADLAGRKAEELSKGNQQKIQLISAVLHDPPVLLMDEPFGAIDPINREVIQDEFMKIQAELKKTVVFVSHDIDEAVKMASRIAIFRDGRLIQYDTPDTILANPVDAFVAEFVGGDRTLKRLRLIKVGDAMMSDPPSVIGEDPLETAVGRMREHGHISIVMVGPRGRARGVVRLESVKDKRGPVAEHHEKLPGMINVKDDLRTAVAMMFTHDITWLACVDDDGFYKGYITQRG
ncbi:MAG TPA: ATP-binding cassette domain-containing protein, partial [Candidatus Limnocylindrales bacterium]|nr:ATP-binding cassette domain-containing protein [Candidatus Limnocylindrales bacterium]